MASSAATTVADYLAELPAERRKLIDAVLNRVCQHLPAGYEGVMAWGMICRQVPLARYPNTYNKLPLMFTALAAQKNHYALYLSCAVEASRGEALVRDACAKAGRKLDMGKSGLRFKKLDDLLIEPIAQVIATPLDDFLRDYEAGRRSRQSAERPDSPMLR